MSKPLSSKEKANIMAQTAQHLVDMIQARYNSRFDTLNALAGSPLDNIPDSVKTMREIEGAKIRSVMQEQKDLIEIIKVLFPVVDNTPKEAAKKGKS